MVDDNKRPITVRLQDDMYKRLRMYSFDTNLSMQKVVEYALDKFMAANKVPSKLK